MADPFFLIISTKNFNVSLELLSLDPKLYLILMLDESK